MHRIWCCCHNLVHARQLFAAQTSPLFNQPRVELPSLAIFYHIVMPFGNDEANLVKESIRGQLLDLFHGLSNSPDSPSATVYYTVVGQELEEGFISRICGDFPKQMFLHFAAAHGVRFGRAYHAISP